MNGKLFFSIIVPVYNVENYLRQCIDSVLSQSADDYELILVNDGSTDKSGEICKEYADRHRNIKLITKENGGLSSARNCGVKNANGDYLMFLDSDDFLCNEDALELLRKATQSSPDFVMFKMNKYFDETEEDSYGDYDENIINNRSIDEIFLYMVKKNKQLACACNKVIKREFIIENNLFFQEGITGEDIEWSVRLFKNAKHICAINEVLYMYRQNRDGSITNTVAPYKLENLYKTIKSVSDEYRNGNEQFDNAVKSFMAFEYAILLYTYPVCNSSISISDIKEYEWLFKYAIDKKSKIIRAVYSIFGYNISMYIIRALRKLR